MCDSMNRNSGQKLPVVGCVIMASGWSRRFGRNKLLEILGDCSVAETTIRAVTAAQDMTEICRWDTVAVTRWQDIAAVCEHMRIRCVLHQDPFQSDTIRHGLEGAEQAGWSACLFVQADQPLVHPESIRSLTEEALRHPDMAVRLMWKDLPGSPVLFPARYFPLLRKLEGEQGGGSLIRSHAVPCLGVQASAAEEMLDVDTPEDLELVQQYLHV